MAFYPEATRKLITPGPNDPPIIVIGAILHVDGGNSSDLYDYFKNQSGGIESHFHIPSAGPVIQMRDTAFEADANLKANSFIDPAGRRVGFMSIETQGYADGEWNQHQLDQIMKVLKWASETHNFPLRVCASSVSPGVGYHIMWGAPGPWTPVAKVCPGPKRVRQFENILVPWFNNHAPSGAGGTPGKVDDLANADEVLKAVQQLSADLKTLTDQQAGRYSRDEKWMKDLMAAILTGKAPAK